VADRRGRAALLGLTLALVVALLLAVDRFGSGDEDGGVVASGVAEHQETDPDGMHGAVLTTPYRLADARLTDSSGQAFDLQAELTAPLTLVFFGYSRCPDICQAVMADLASTVARLDEAQAEKVAVWFVTTDPARDDPGTLRSYLDRFDPSFEGLTGPLADIVRVAASVHVAIENGPRLSSGGYDVTHGTPVLGIRDDGSVPILWTEGTSAARLAEDVHTLLTDGLPAGAAS
jgi:protein SCO1/2